MIFFSPHPGLYWDRGWDMGWGCVSLLFILSSGEFVAQIKSDICCFIQIGD